MVMGIETHQNQGVAETYKAFVDNYTQARRAIYAFIYILVGNAADADDVFQEVCVVLWRRFDQFQPGTNFLAWAKQIARNLVMDLRKRRFRRRVTGLDDKTADMLAARFERIQDQIDDRIEALKHCLTRLDTNERDLLKAAYERGEPVKRIAKKAEVSVQGIYKRLGNVHGSLLRCVERTLEKREVGSMTGREARELDAAMMHLLKGRMTLEERDELQNNMAEDLEVLNRCLDLMVVSAGLEWIRRDQKNAVDPLKDRPRRGLRIWRIVSRQQRGILLAAKIAAVVVVGTFVAFMAVRNGQPHDTRDLAQVITELATRWAGAPGAMGRGTQLGSGPRYLMEGIAEIRMASGAEVVLRGPCRFSVEGENRVFLASGGLTARVPVQARGFVVSTRQADVVDTGTEFGVIVESDGRVEAHVFSGQVVLVRDVAGPNTAQVRLVEGMAAAVSTTGEIKKAPASPERFTRTVPEGPVAASPGRQLDVADIVGGGNGFGNGKLGRGFDPSDGQVVQSPALRRAQAKTLGYVILLGNGYVDGVFVPNGKNGPNAVSSTGLVFPDCPETDGTYVGGILNGTAVTGPDQGWPGASIRLKGREYGTSAAPAISLHPNAGITVDLDRIRRDNPGALIRAFKGLCGISETTPGRPASPADFWVLVDGQVRFHYRSEPDDRIPATIHVALDSRAHYLTLATTCPGYTENNWAVVAEPLIELGPVQ